jgi:hypothetical protein
MAAPTHPVSHPANGLQDFIAISRCARYPPEKRRRETWSEAVARVRTMHLAHYGERSLSDAKLAALDKGEVTREEPAAIERLNGGLHAAIRAAFDAVARREVLPSMRSLQFGGDAILTKHARVYNCCFTYIDRLEAFRETLYLLLCGCGVGFSVQQHHVAKLPAFAPRDERLPPLNHVVADTIEGWGEALHALMENAVAGRSAVFDYSQIRAEGAPLRTSGGKAPGSAPLFHTLSRAERLARAAGDLREGDEVTGVQFCNLSTISAAAAETPADFYQLCAHAALIGTLQAGYTQFGYLSPVSRVITEREALLGVLLCGILDRPGVLLDPAVLRAGPRWSRRPTRWSRAHSVSGPPRVRPA